MYDDDILKDDQTTIEDDENTAKMKDIIENIELLTADYLQKAHAETITELTQQQYTGLLQYCAINYFRPTKVLLKPSPNTLKNNTIIYMYNDDLLCLLSEYYINLSLLHNKIINPYGFCMLIGCDVDQIERWAQQESQRPRLCGMIKRLRKAYETSLEYGAQSGKNPVGFIAALNHRFNWSSDSKPQLTVNITRSQDQILKSFDAGLITEKP